MDIIEYEKKILDSESTDWRVSENKESFVLKNDISITIQLDDFTKNDFYDPRLIGCFQDDSMSYHMANLLYNGAAIDNFYYIAVDGGIMYIPTFDSEMVASKFDYKLASIISQLVISENEKAEDRVKSYLNRAKITIE